MTSVPGGRSILIEHGPRTDLIAEVAVWPTVAATLTALLFAAAVAEGQTGGLGLVTGVLVIYLVMLGLTVGIYLVTTTERIEIDDAGIRRYGRIEPMGPQRWLTRVIRWEWLDSTPRGAIGLGFVKFRWHQPGGYLEWFRLSGSPQQARAILTHPRCPKARIDERTGRRLGLPPDPSDADRSGVLGPP